MPTCEVPGCATRKLAPNDTICVRHKNMWNQWGTFDCRAGGCNAPIRNRGLCTKHYQRLVTTGSYEDPKPSVHLSIAPLVAYVAARGGRAEAFKHGTTQAERDRWDKIYDRAMRQGYITLGAADDFAVHALRTHPCLVWGEEWWGESLAS